MSGVRLDKWLWAARFYRTRSLARAAIEGGKVWYDGARPKVSKEVHAGAVVRVRQGFEEKTVVVLALSEERRGAPEAAPERRPDKRERRQIHRFREEMER
jgi:ribosome-associated heat shock protein Hsp15